MQHTKTDPKADRCFIHADWAERGPCTPAECATMGEARMLEDRVGVIDYLAEVAREAVLAGSDEAGGMPLSAALEAIRVLAISITEDPGLKVPGHDESVRWIVLPTTKGLRFEAEARPARLANRS